VYLTYKKFENYLRKILIPLIFLFNHLLFAQVESNLDRINLLINKTCNEINDTIKHSAIINFQAPSNLYFLKNRAEVNFNQFYNKNNLLPDTLNFTLEAAGINYNKIIKNGFFGDYLVERTAFIKGTYLLKQNDKILIAKEFNKSVTDSVNYEDINKIENYSLPFTKGKLPDEPIASSIIEPLIAITASVVTVILFFTVRSK